MGMPKHCFQNSFMLAIRRKLVYVEGYAVVSGVGLPILHAWCVRPGSDEVIDVTTTNVEDYFGIPFDTEFVKRQRANSKSASLIDNWCDDFPLLTMPEEELCKVIAN